MFIKKKKYDELVDSLWAKEKYIKFLEATKGRNDKEICKLYKHGILRRSENLDGCEFCGCDLDINCEKFERKKESK